MGKEPLAAIREREIYARIDRILCHKHIEFALEHQKDSLEQLTEYLKACTDDLGHLPRKCEVIGGEFIALCFGSWEVALETISTGNIKSALTPLRASKRKIVQELYREQDRIVRAEMKRRQQPRTLVWRADG